MLLLKVSTLQRPVLHYRDVYTTGACAASECLYTKETCAASECVYTTEACAAPEYVYITGPELHLHLDLSTLHESNWDNCRNCVHTSVLFYSTWVAVQKTKNTVLPLLTHKSILSAMNIGIWGGGGGVGSGSQCIKFSHHISFWLHIFI